MSVINQFNVDVEPVIDENADDLVYLGMPMRITIGAFVVIPLIAVAVAIPVAWGGWLSWLDIGLGHCPSGFSPLAASRSATTASSPTDHSRPIVA